MERKFLWVGLAILLLVILASGATYWYLRTNSAFHGSVINPAFAAPDFTLTDQAGQPVRLSQYRGEYVLLFFGYTHCTQECPATLAILRQARSQLGSQAERVQVLFVSTDPVNDTPAALGVFLNRFDSSFMGATGSTAQLQKVWSDYGVTVLDGGETHSSYTYLIDPSGNLRLTYAYSTTADEIDADLQKLFRDQ